MALAGGGGGENVISKKAAWLSGNGEEAKRKSESAISAKRKLAEMPGG